MFFLSPKKKQANTLSSWELKTLTKVTLGGFIAEVLIHFLESFHFRCRKCSLISIKLNFSAIIVTKQHQQ